MSPLDWAKRPLTKYAEFTGRAPRAEFWWYVLMIIALSVVAMIIESMLGLQPIIGPYAPLTLVISLGTLVPTVAVQVRRLHDTNKPGYWLVPFYILYAILIYIIASTVQNGVQPTPDTAGLATLGMVSLVIGIYAIVLLVFFALAGTRGSNSYGEDPYAGTQAATPG